MVPEKKFNPSISVIVNTNGRAESLQQLLDSLRHLDYQNFEVCIVCGPTPDGTRELVAQYGDEVKSADCPELNLSQSRNIGIALAAGEIVAFIDDDAIPEPEWLSQLSAPFADDEVGAAGGFVYNHTGYDFQSKWVACDRLGNPRFDLTGPTPEYNFPYSLWYPHLLGTNAGFRRTKLVGIGGFDEEFEYYLDETDVCCRLNDDAQKIIQLDNAFVHHKYLPSHIRNTRRVPTSYFSILKNKIYFSLVNGRDHFARDEIFQELVKYVSAHRVAMQAAVDAGTIPEWTPELFEDDAERAWYTGVQRALSGQRRTRPESYFDAPIPFQPFLTIKPCGDRKNFVFLSEIYPPADMAGVARYTYDMARAISSLGHTVHVLTKGTEFDRVDLEEGVWVHRIVPRTVASQNLPDGTPVPQHILNYSATQLREIERITTHRDITVVEGSGWNCECIAAIMDGRYPCIVNVVTPFACWLDTHREYSDDADWMKMHGEAILGAEKYLFTEAQGVIAATRGIVKSIADRYGVHLSDDRTGLLPHGMTDMAPLRRSAIETARGISRERSAILFVGRLELRKGIDVLLDAVTPLLSERPDLELWVAGDDTLALNDGRTAKEAFVASDADPEVKQRVVFLGQVPEGELRWLYAECAFVVMPSRFESFGLIAVEAMMFAKPVIGCRGSGSEDLISHGEDGLLIKPGDAGDLAAAIERLLEDRSLREAMGEAGRAKYEKRFAVNAVAGNRVAYLSRFARLHVDFSDGLIHGGSKMVSLPHEQHGLMLEPHSALVLDVEAPRYYVSFFQHAWSGIVEISVDNGPLQDADLYSEHDGFRTIVLDTTQATYIKILRPDRPGSGMLGTEVIVAKIQIDKVPSDTADPLLEATS